ncbi:hypothetical protein AB0N65_15240 [Paenarthrobacter sp. NPDC089322]|uniref:hypothetical protein n=1 Tax=Paenarthrobacter sp. NPDC089322 TaxID=3155065 RepID=UPI00341AC4E7
MKRKPLVWLLLALALFAYAVSIFITSPAESVWSMVSGVICITASAVVFWRFLAESRADRSEQ